MKTIQFSKAGNTAAIIAVALVVVGAVGTFLQGGFNFGIDFEAGLSQQVRFASNVAIEEIRGALSEVAQGSGAEIQAIGARELNEYIVRVSDTGVIDNFEDSVSHEIADRLSQRFGSGTVELLSRSYVGPKFSQDLTGQAIWLVVGALSLVLIYLWIRFKVGFALAAIISTVHDVVFMIVFIGVFQMEITSVTIAAVLTIVGYSLNDTIVVFDRIRENEGLMSGAKLPHIVDVSVSQSLSRTIMTSLTTMVAVGAILIFTTGAIQSFALAVMVGIVVGTFSSIFIASPAYIWISGLIAAGQKRREERLAKPVPAKKKGK